MRNKLLISNDSCLFEAIHAFCDIDVNISILGDNSINPIECSNFNWELF